MVVITLTTTLQFANFRIPNLDFRFEITKIQNEKNNFSDFVLLMVVIHVSITFKFTSTITKIQNEKNNFYDFVFLMVVTVVKNFYRTST